MRLQLLCCPACGRQTVFSAKMGMTAAGLGHGVRTPVRKALLAAAVTPETYGRALGFERMMDTLGAIVGPATAFVLLPWVGHHYPTLFALTLIPGLLAVAAITLLMPSSLIDYCMDCRIPCIRCNRSPELRCEEQYEHNQLDWRIAIR